MASKNIKGITIEIGGNTTKLEESLKSVNSELRDVTSELKATNKALKFDPTNTDLIKDKMVLLSKAITGTEEKLATLKKAQEQMKSAGIDETSEQYRGLTREISYTENQLKGLKKQQSDINGKNLRDLGEGANEAGVGVVKLGDLIKANLLSDAIKAGFKELVSLTKKIGGAFIEAGKQALSSYADYEQLTGGVQKLFGEESAKIIEKNASQAFKTAGLSANEYMETVTTFSASLIKSLGGDTQKAANLADQTLQDMADNANIFGTSMESVQNVYSALSRGMYSTLDNLKLGYAGSKEGMQQLINDANAYNKTIGKNTKYQINSYADIVSAIHDIQKQQKIMGTTSKEAATTITGSLNSMKSAWKNLLTGLGDENADIGKLVEDLFDTLLGYVDEESGKRVGGVINNILPRIGEILEGIAGGIIALIDGGFLEEIVGVVTGLVNSIIENLDTLLPSFINALSLLINNLISTLASFSPQINSVISQLLIAGINIIVTNIPAILQTVITLMTSVIQTLTEQLPTLLPVILDGLMQCINLLLDNIDLIIETAITFIVTFAETLAEWIGKPEFVDNVVKIVVKIVSVLIKEAPQLLKAALEIILALGKGLIDMLGNIKDKVLEIVPKICDWLLEGVSKAVDVGKRLMEGLWNGIKKTWDGLKQKVNSLGEGIVNKFKSVFGIHSPSKVMEQTIGVNLGLGLIKGIEDTKKEMNQAISDLSSGITASVNPTINPQASVSPLIINIDKFNNTRSQDVQAFAHELEIYRQNAALGQGAR